MTLNNKTEQPKFPPEIKEASLDEIFRDAKLTPEESEILTRKIDEAKTQTREETKDYLKWLVSYIAYERKGKKYTEAEKKQIFDFFSLAVPPKTKEKPQKVTTQSPKPVSQKENFTAEVIDTESNTNSFKNITVDANIPENERCDQAQFLIGFTFSEQLKDYDAARSAFSRLVENYPESELADDAEWMIENMEIPIEEFIPADSETPGEEPASE